MQELYKTILSSLKLWNVIERTCRSWNTSKINDIIAVTDKCKCTVQTSVHEVWIYIKHTHTHTHTHIHTHTHTHTHTHKHTQVTYTNIHKSRPRTQWRSQDLILGGAVKITCEGAKRRSLSERSERGGGGGGGCGMGVSPLPQWVRAFCILMLLMVQFGAYARYFHV